MVIKSTNPKVEVVTEEQKLTDVQEENRVINVDICSFALLISGELTKDRRDADHRVQNVVHEKRNYHVQFFWEDKSSIDRVDCPK